VSDTNKPSLKPVPDPEVSDRPKRRSFTAEFKLNILRELDAITEPGQVGEVLRREGLYSSHISDWRRLRALGELQALEAKRPAGRRRSTTRSRPGWPRLSGRPRGSRRSCERRT
jgi:transposase-like protein